MFQTFDAPKATADSTARLAEFREEMADLGVDGYLVPRADRFQGEYVAPCDERLAWLTGFTGSAGLAIITRDLAGVFSDSRYTLQLREQIGAGFTPETLDFDQVKNWIIAVLPEGGKIGYDPWQNTSGQISTLQKSLREHNIELVACDNIIDRIWQDRPTPPAAPAQMHPLKYAGVSSVEKRKSLAQLMTSQGHEAYFIGAPENVCWLCNIRGQDVPRVPVLHSYGVLYSDGRVDILTDTAKTAKLKCDDGMRILPLDALETEVMPKIKTLSYSPESTPQAVLDLAKAQDKTLKICDRIVSNAQARKNKIEMQGARKAHERDALAMIRFLAWFDAHKTSGLSEIDVVKRLEEMRRETGALRDISFDTISATGPHGAMAHYRVNEQTNMKIVKDSFFLVDSGGQYLDGTTDITRTIAVGKNTEAMKRAYTGVLKGMITLSQARFPAGTTGQQLDALARQGLWQEGLDYGHGTGHGLGSYLSVHEGPVSLSPRSQGKVEVGLILSNEPGYYATGKFGIRIENILLVRPVEALSGAFLEFETLTQVPIDKAAIKVEKLTSSERDWLNTYHRKIYDKFSLKLSQPERQWLESATSSL